MPDSKQHLITRIIPEKLFQQLADFWAEIASQEDNAVLYLSEDNLINNPQQFIGEFPFKNFRLLIASNFQALLFVEKLINNLYYQVSITVDEQEIKDFCQLLEKNISLDINKQIKQVKKKVVNIDSNKFIFSLLKIISEPLKVQDNYFTNYYNYQPIELILRNRIEQEKILHQVSQQIQQNLDLLVIVKMTIEQVQHLLQLDRLVIYQFNVKVKSDINSEPKLIDIITYEAKTSTIIPSVLGFQEESCFRNNGKCKNKYLQDYNLIIDDINECELDNCLLESMKKFAVKAKIAIPIIVKNELWGLLIAHQCFNSRKWKTSEVKFLKHISEYLAVAIYQSNSYNQLQEQKKLLEEQIEKKAKQLQDALIAAEIAHQSKTEFLGNISHELRTPLTCVIGLSGTLLNLSKSASNKLPLEQQTRYLKIIQESGRKLLQLINNILDFADLEAGKSLLKIEEISLENICKMVLLYGLEIARNKGVKVRLDYQVSPELDLFYADSERLYQILINLVDNAIKFTTSGGEVILKVRRNQNQIIFQIKDTGIGIYKEQIPLLFNKFQQLENYRTRSHPGTGLGLALTKHLVELHGGIIEVESVVSKGSTFTVYLPNSDNNYSQSIPENKSLISPENINKTIVIICQDNEIGTFLCELLTAAEFQVIWLVDVTEAINRIKLVQPKMVIIEQNIEVSRHLAPQIKAESKDIYLMIIKEEISGNEWEELSNSGIDEYLLKPLQPRILLKKINQIITQL